MQGAAEREERKRERGYRIEKLWRNCASYKRITLSYDFAETTPYSRRGQCTDEEFRDNKKIVQPAVIRETEGLNDRGGGGEEGGIFLTFCSFVDTLRNDRVFLFFLLTKIRQIQFFHLNFIFIFSDRFIPSSRIILNQILTRYIRKALVMIIVDD